ncbi:hypothetical protein [Klebsiella pneumoniae]
MDLLLVADDMSVSGDAKLADALRALLAAHPGQPEPRDAIARSKRILALVDEYHENPTRDTRTALRVALMDEFRLEPRAEVTREPSPDWMTCESRRPFVVNSIRARVAELRDAEKRCRNAYRKDFMGVPARYVADAYGEAAAALEARLVAIDAARAGDAA